MEWCLSLICVSCPMGRSTASQATGAPGSPARWDRVPATSQASGARARISRPMGWCSASQAMGCGAGPLVRWDRVPPPNRRGYGPVSPVRWDGVPPPKRRGAGPGVPSDGMEYRLPSDGTRTRVSRPMGWSISLEYLQSPNRRRHRVPPDWDAPPSSPPSAARAAACGRSSAPPP